MKLKKILAAVAAAAVAVSAMAVSAFALSGKDYVKDTGSGLNTIFIQADKDTDPSWVNDSGVAITEVYGAKFYITGKGDWYGGKVCVNSNSTGWKEIDEWDNGSKPIVEVDGVVTYLVDKPLFADSDEYAQICLMVYPGSDVTVNNVEILGKDGVVLSTDDAPAADAAPADDAAPAAAEAAEIWTGSNDLGTDWDGSKAVIIDGAQFANTKGGDTVEISYTTGGGADYSNVKICENANNWAALESPTGMDPQWGTVLVDEGSTSYSFVISDADVDKIQASGMVVSGYNVTITKVAVSGAAASAPVAEETAAVEEAPEAEEADEDVDVDEEEEEEAAPAVTEAPAAEVAPAVENTPAPATGNTAVASVVAVMAVAGVAAIAAKKRK